MVWWKEFWRYQKQSTDNEIPEEYETRFKATSLNTDRKPKFGLKTAKHSSDNIKVFLTAVERTLLKEEFLCQRFIRPNKKTRETQEVHQKMENPRSVCVTTNKTNSTRVINISDYKLWVSKNLLKADHLALRPILVALSEEANGLIDQTRMNFSDQEEQFVRQLLAT